MAAAALVAALGAGLAVGPAAGRAEAPPAGLARVVAEVERVRHSEAGRARSVVRVVEGRRLEDGARFAEGVRLSVKPLPLQQGARVEMLLRVRPWMPFRNPTPHPRLPATKAVSGSGWIPSKGAVRVVDAGWSGGLQGFRARVRRALWRTLPGASAGVACALTLGDAGAVGAEQREAVRGAGLAHVFAVSGLHVAILAGLMVAGVRRGLLWVPAVARRFDAGRIACALGVPLALGYAGFAGGAPSAWRAAVTASIGWALVAAGRRPRAGAVAAAAALLLGAVRPHQAAHPGFLLSIVATAAIMSAPRVRGGGAGALVRAAFTVSSRATIGTAPIILWCFGSVPVVGLLANVVLVPVGTMLLVPLVALHAVVATFLEVAAPVTALPVDVVARAFVAACRVFADTPLSGPMPVPDVAQGAAVAVGAALLLAARRWRTRAAVCVVTAAAVLAGEAALRARERPTGGVRVTFLDVGQGDAALVDLPDGRFMVIDGGGNPNGGPDPGRAVLLPLLRARRRGRVDVAVLSHPHPDHYGGLRALVDAVEVGELWDTGQAEAESETVLGGEMSEAELLLARARERGTRVKGPGELCGRPRRFGGAVVEVLAPCPGYSPWYDANNNSLVVRIDYSNRSFLFTGDVEAEGEGLLLERAGGRLGADVLKVPHHGSGSSSTAGFVEAVGAELAVVSAGAFNMHGHPAPAVVRRLAGAGARVVRIDRAGGTVVTTDGEDLRVESRVPEMVESEPAGEPVKHGRRAGHAGGERHGALDRAGAR
jgi:competence protein ComEC